MNLLTQILAGSSGKQSSMRAVMLYAYFIVLATWSYISVVKQELQGIDQEIVMLLVGASLGKVYQRKLEGKTEETK